MFTDQQHSKALEWVKKAIRSDYPKEQLNPSIDDVAKDSKRQTNFLLWAIWATSGDLDNVLIGQILIEFFDQNPIFTSRLSGKNNTSFFRELILGLERDSLKEKLKEGSHCSTCGQYCKEYKRSFNTNQAIFLLSLVKKNLLDVAKGGHGWIHHSDLKYTGRDYTMVAQFGLATTEDFETPLNSKRKKKTTGDWKPTPKGIAFVRGECTIPSFLFMFNRKVHQSADAKQITFKDALGSPFVFEDLYN